MTDIGLTLVECGPLSPGLARARPDVGQSRPKLGSDRPDLGLFWLWAELDQMSATIGQIELESTKFGPASAHFRLTLTGLGPNSATSAHIGRIRPKLCRLGPKFGHTWPQSAEFRHRPPNLGRLDQSWAELDQMWPGIHQIVLELGQICCELIRPKVAQNRPMAQDRPNSTHIARNVQHARSPPHSINIGPISAKFGPISASVVPKSTKVVPMPTKLTPPNIYL